MNGSSPKTFTRELKSFAAPFSSTVDPQLLLIKHQVLKYLKDCLKTIETKNVYIITNLQTP